MDLCLATALATMLLGAGPAPTDDQVRMSIERSLPFLQTEGQRWIDEKKCVTCHQVPFMVWALNSAAERGFAVDRQKLQAWRDWATDWKHMANKQQLEEGGQKTLSAQHDSVAQLLLGRPAADRDPTAAAWAAQFAECLAAGQLPDGSWKAGGQLPSQRRPERETHEVTTMWALAALQSYAAADESLQTRLAKARSWLGTQTEGQSTEWWAARLLAERGGGNAQQADRMRDLLLQRQHEDGGWGWLTSDGSDAFGTGVALYALTRDGLLPDHAAIARGRHFLTQTQQQDGSWSVKGTKKGKADKVEPTATYWGTCWAVIGLLEALPR
jgi:squalene-hopene/tetraprenyl-beta-curcumene cyclase